MSPARAEASSSSSTRSISMSPESARPVFAGTVDARLPPFAHPLVRGGAQREGLEDAEKLVDAFGVSMRGRNAAYRHVQRRRQGPAQFLVGASLDLAGAPAARDGRGSEVVEQHRLADAAQPSENDTAFRSAAGDAFEHDVEGVELLLSTGELGWALACAGSVRVTHGVHDRSVCGSLAFLADILIQPHPRVARGCRRFSPTGVRRVSGVSGCLAPGRDGRDTHRSRPGSSVGPCSRQRGGGSSAAGPSSSVPCSGSTSRSACGSSGSSWPSAPGSSSARWPSS